MFIPGKAGRLVSCSQDGKVEDLVKWKEADYQRFGGMRAVDLDVPYLAVTGSRGVRMYKLTD